jgi:glutamate-1-semialdehyde 2,1-aminomutase
MIIGVVQARLGSVRLPNKVMRRVGGFTLIEILLSRLARSTRLDKVILATTTTAQDQLLTDHVRQLGFEVFQGSEADVLDRYYQAAKAYRPAAVVRITGDCPLTDPVLVDEAIAAYQSQAVDYLSNTQPPTYPDGLDIEVFSFHALERSASEAAPGPQREHVTPYMYQSGSFRIGSLRYHEDLSRERWTVDEAVDFEVMAAVFRHFSPRIDFGWLEVLELRRAQPALFEANQYLVRNEGSSLSSGQKLWKRAKRVIPGGGMLLSKRPEMFLPERWPTYFSKAKGCRVWDLDEREYIDMSLMGIGTNVLGYGQPDVDDAVRQTVDRGNMSTLNCPEEVYLAEKLVAMHPWADMVRFARSGGEANAITIRIARAASGKDKVAICGYHGWHDWYLSANLGDDKNLAGHLLPGLDPKGVPQNLRGTVFPFNYNNFAELEELVMSQNIGVIMMEVSRNAGPENQFLQRVRQLATVHGIVLIFDECTSGFRQTFGGLHLMYGVEPDMAIFGKTLGNGYAITATIGRREVMEAAQGTFISSTFWTERIGPSAALKTLEVMQRMRSWDQITHTGLGITARWKALAGTHRLSITTTGLPALTGFSFNGPNALAYKTLITQEMLSKGFLAGTGIYVCTEHTPQIVDRYFEELDPIFSLIRQCEDGRDVFSLLKSPICSSGFKRLN